MRSSCWVAREARRREHWLARGAVALRLPMVYGPYDRQRREDPVLRRVRAGRRRMPIGAGNLLWTRAHVDDIATGVLAAVDIRALAPGEPADTAWTDEDALAAQV